MRIKWSYLAGTAGTIVAILGLIWSIYSYYGQQAHERDIARQAIEAEKAGASDVTINIKAPDIDVDRTMKAIGDGAHAAKVKTDQVVDNAIEATRETAADLKTKARQRLDSVKRYWHGKQERERDPFVPPAEVTDPSADHPESK